MPQLLSSGLSELSARRNEWQSYLKLSEGKPQKKRVPDVVRIGAEKCGTGAISSFLGLHPFVKTPEHPESYFFSNNNNYYKGLDHYRNMMPEAADHQLIMEKTPRYFDAPPIDLPNRIKRDLPNAKLILVVCDPVKRSFSDYTHEKIKFKLYGRSLGIDENRYPTYDSYLDIYLDRVKADLSGDYTKLLHQYMRRYMSDLAAHILTKGFYSVYLRRWLELFDSTKLLILSGDKLIDEPGTQFERIQEFLGIPKFLQANDFVRNPTTGLFCVRPWWTNYSFEDEWSSECTQLAQTLVLPVSKGRQTWECKGKDETRKRFCDRHDGTHGVAEGSLPTF